MNIISRNVRLFPVDCKPLEKSQIDGILKMINKKNECLYQWNNEGNYLDILYVSKNMSEYFYNENLLSVFHFWQIDADEGYAEDSIKGQTKFYNTNEGTTKFDYYSTCFYQIDKIRFNGNNENFETLIKDKLKKEFDFPITINDLTYLRKVKMIYTASNDRLNFSDNFRGNQEIEMKDLLVDDGLMLRMLFSSNEIFGMKGLNSFQFIMSETVKELHESIDSIELLFKGRVVHDHVWNVERKCWFSRTGDFWDNCADSEYIRFEEWYKNKKAIANM